MMCCFFYEYFPENPVPFPFHISNLMPASQIVAGWWGTSQGTPAVAGGTPPTFLITVATIWDAPYLIWLKFVNYLLFIFEKPVCLNLILSFVLNKF